MMDPKRTVTSKRPVTDAGTEFDIFGTPCKNRSYLEPGYIFNINKSALIRP